VPLLLLTSNDLQRRSLKGRSTTGERYYLPPSHVVQALSFGYNEFAADLLWVRTINYFATHIHTDRDLRNLHRYLQVILALDPYFAAVYRYGASMLSIDAGSNETVLQAIAVLEAGHKHFPEKHTYPLKIGMLYANELKTRDVAQKKRWRLRGAHWLRRAILLGADRPWLATLAAQLYSKGGELQMAIHHLQEIYLITQDPAARRQIAAKLRHMQGKGIAAQLKKTHQRLRDAQRDSRIPFVSLDLFLLIDPPKEQTPGHG